MSDLERLQLCLLDRTTKRRHARELECAEFRECEPQGYCPPTGAARAMALVIVCMAGSLAGGIVAFFIFR